MIILNLLTRLGPEPLKTASATALHTIYLVSVIHICHHLKQGHSWPRPAIHGPQGVTSISALEAYL